MNQVDEPNTVRYPRECLAPRILFAESDTAHRNDLTNALVDDGHEVVSVDNGFEVLACLRIIAEYGLRAPSVIALEVGTPRYAAVAIAETIRSCGFRTPLVLMTATRVHDLRAAVAHLSDVTVLAKPVDIDRMRAAIIASRFADLTRYEKFYDFVSVTE